ncbi:unnamed protein product [Lathyrus sativus]|nr:unnamed protein product [Lathyrus sativus]
MSSSFQTFNKQFPVLPFHHHHHHDKFRQHQFSYPLLSPSCVNYSYRTISCSQSRSSSHSSSIAKQEVAAHDSVALRADQKSYSYNQLITSAQKLSNLLCENDVKGNLGGARIGIVAKPSAEFVVGILAIWFSGGVAVPLALSFPEVELLYVMNNSDVSALLSTEDRSELMQSIANKTSSRFFHIPPVPNKSSENSNNGHSKNGKNDVDRIFLENIVRSIEDPSLILYTSGTTGKPKGVVHTHRSILAQIQALTKAWEFTSADRFLHCLPLHHIHETFF